MYFKMEGVIHTREMVATHIFNTFSLIGQNLHESHQIYMEPTWFSGTHVNVNQSKRVC